MKTTLRYSNPMSSFLRWENRGVERKRGSVQCPISNNLLELFLKQWHKWELSDPQESRI